MVVALGPGRFYGSSLPRPRIYTDIKLNEERVDPPLPVSAPFLSWATEAHWSMGGLSFKRHRLQGRIEGNVKKLRAEKEKAMKKKNKEDKVFLSPPVTDSSPPSTLCPSSPDKGDKVASPPIPRRKRARKLGDEFDKVASRLSGEIEMSQHGEEKLIGSKAAESDRESMRSSPRRISKGRVGKTHSPDASGVAIASPARNRSSEKEASDANAKTRNVIRGLKEARNRRSEKEASDTNAKARSLARGLKEAPSRIKDKKWKGGRKGISVDLGSRMLAAARVTRNVREVARTTRSSSKVSV